MREHAAEVLGTAHDRTDRELREQLLHQALAQLLADEPCVAATGWADVHLVIRTHPDRPDLVTAAATALCDEPSCAVEHRGRPVQ